MHIYVKILKGNEIEVAVSPSHTVLEVKGILEMQFCMPVNEQKLVFKGKPLVDQKRLSEYKIKDGDKLFLFQKKPDSGSAVGTPISTPVTPITPFAAVRPSSLTTPIARTSVPPEELQHCSSMVLWIKLREFLERHFTKQDAAKVVIEFQKDFYSTIKFMSLDDIERLASNKIRGHSMNGHEQMT